MQVAVIQLNSQEDVPTNLARATTWIGEAAKAGAELVVLPENFAFMGEEAKKRELAEHLDGSFPGPIVSALSEAAVRYKVNIIGGGMPEKSTDPSRPFNASVLIDSGGRLITAYRKIHLFDVSLADGTVLRESAAASAGREPLTVEIGGIRFGMTICYDLRFPELFRKLVDQGARVITVPAAFTLTTGKDHWHVLLRARAIENGAYVVAAAQHGRHPKGRQTYGKSVIIDPWGDVIAQCSEGEGFAMARIDIRYLDAVRAQLPSLLHRKW